MRFSQKNDFEVIGIVANTHSLSVSREDSPWYYVPMQGLRFTEGKLWIRYRGSAAAAERALRAATQQEDPEVTLTARRAEECVAIAMMPVRIAS